MTALTLVATAEAPPALSPGREALRQAIAAVQMAQAANHKYPWRRKMPPPCPQCEQCPA
jgi:hypothetical protein